MASYASALIKTAIAEIGYKEKRTNAQLDDKTANAGGGNWTKYARDFDNKWPNWYNGKKTYVDALKKSQQFDKEAQEWALQVALAQAQRLLTEDAKSFLTEAYGDLSKYLEGRIEAEVRNQKVGFGTLTLSA